MRLGLITTGILAGLGASSWQANKENASTPSSFDFNKLPASPFNQQGQVVHLDLQPENAFDAYQVKGISTTPVDKRFQEFIEDHKMVDKRLQKFIEDHKMSVAKLAQAVSTIKVTNKILKDLSFTTSNTDILRKVKKYTTIAEETLISFEQMNLEERGRKLIKMFQDLHAVNSLDKQTLEMMIAEQEKTISDSSKMSVAIQLMIQSVSAQIKEDNERLMRRPNNEL